MRRGETKALRVVMKMNVKGKRGRGIREERCLDTVENDMRAVGVCVGYVENQDKWRFRIKVADPK